MERQDFSLGNGMTLSLYDSGSVFFGPIPISIWRNLMPQWTLRSGLETLQGWEDLEYDDFRADGRALKHFLKLLSDRCGRKVVLFEKSHIGDYAQILESMGVDFDSALYISIFK